MSSGAWCTNRVADPVLRWLLRSPAGRPLGRSPAIVRYTGTCAADVPTYLAALPRTPSPRLPADPSPGGVAGAAQRAVLVRFDTHPRALTPLTRHDRRTACAR